MLTTTVCVYSYFDVEHETGDQLEDAINQVCLAVSGITHVGAGWSAQQTDAELNYIESPDAEDDEPMDPMTDAEADADVLRSAGMGTDEDYGYYPWGEE